MAAEKVVFESEAAAFKVGHLDQTERGFDGWLHDHGGCRDDSCAGVLGVGRIPATNVNGSASSCFHVDILLHHDRFLPSRFLH